MIVIHSTHEAGIKVGGIGAMLDGLLAASSYNANVERTILVGPMNTRDGTEMERLLSARNHVWVRYFSDRNMMDYDYDLSVRFHDIERVFGVRLFYGTRDFGLARHEIILVDASEGNQDRLNTFKYYVWQRFGLDSGRHQHEPEFNLYMAMAEPAFAALHTILDFGLRIADSNAQSKIRNPKSEIILCHEFMGLPLWYAAELALPRRFKSAFVAHEVATVRPIIEADGGHDTRFYNVMRLAQKEGLYLEDVFGGQWWNFKHPMIKTASQCDCVLAVGDFIVDELRFLNESFKRKKIDLVYNGAPSRKVSIDEARESSRKLKSYAQTLTGIWPSFVFSHVTRMVISKALWRDIRVMEQLDPLLAARGESAALFMLSSVVPQGRSSAEAQRMAREYGWPRNHREGWPDLIALEVDLYRGIAHFNRTARASRIVLINQFGFSRDRCGDSMPADMQFDDLRLGSDLEFGQSIYEPFGIAQIEPLSSGALCVVSDVCGCIGFVRRAERLEIGDQRFDTPSPKSLISNLLVAEYTKIHVESWRSAMRIGQWERDQIERATAFIVAREIMNRLPRSPEQKQTLIEQGYQTARRMSWDVVAREQLLPAIM